MRISAAQYTRIALPSSFAVWLIYGTLAAVGHWSTAVVLGLAAGICLIILDLAVGVAIKMFDWVFVGYFVLAALATFVFRSSEFGRYSSVIIWLLYGGVSWLSLLFGAPFSLQYARESTPREHWDHPAFVHANVVITVAWGIAFLIDLAMAVAALVTSNHGLWLSAICPLLVMLAATLFTQYYTGYSRRSATA